jgi:hypothetical protein
MINQEDESEPPPEPDDHSLIANQATDAANRYAVEPLAKISHIVESPVAETPPVRVVAPQILVQATKATCTALDDFNGIPREATASALPSNPALLRVAKAVSPNRSASRRSLRLSDLLQPLRQLLNRPSGSASKKDQPPVVAVQTPGHACHRLTTNEMLNVAEETLIADAMHLNLDELDQVLEPWQDLLRQDWCRLLKCSADAKLPVVSDQPQIVDATRSRPTNSDVATLEISNQPVMGDASSSTPRSNEPSNGDTATVEISKQPGMGDAAQSTICSNGNFDVATVKVLDFGVQVTGDNAVEPRAYEPFEVLVPHVSLGSINKR